MNSGVYEIVNLRNGKRYVGSALNFSQRWNEHKSMLGRGRHHSKHLQFSFAQYGTACFDFKRLVICAPKDLILYEQATIDVLRPEYNIAPNAGSTLGRKHSEETKSKIAAKAVGRKRDPESVARGAEKRRGVPLSAEHRAHLLGNKFRLGKRHSQERRAAISLQMTGIKRPKDAAYRAKIAATLTGRKATPEHRANQSAAQLGKKRGPYKTAARLAAREVSA